MPFVISFLNECSDSMFYVSPVSVAEFISIYNKRENFIRSPRKAAMVTCQVLGDYF